MVLLNTHVGRHITEPALIELIKCESCRLDVYPDPVTKSTPYTVGVGATRDDNGHPFKSGQQINLEQAQKLLARDVYKEEQCIAQNFNGAEVNDAGEYIMPQSVFEALVSLEHTVGCGGISSGGKGGITNLRRYALQHDYVKTCTQIKAYNKAGGKVNQGIVNRREREYKWCMTDIEKEGE